MVKEQLRDGFLKLRNSIKDTKEKSEHIIGKLYPFIKDKHNICIYISKDSEVNTHNLVRNALVPYIEDDQIKLSRVKDENDLQLGKFNILEPKKKQDYKDQIDIILVPGLIFDENLNRIGYGRGFYDRFLENKSAIKIGLAFEEQIVNNIYPEPHDIKMDLIITNKRIIKND